MAFHRDDDEDLGRHEMQLLAHLPVHRDDDDGISLTALAKHLLLPKSSASVIVRSLEERGFLIRVRRPGNERELSISLTDAGRRRVQADTVLQLAPLGKALGALSAAERATLFGLLTKLADASAPATAKRG